MKYKVVTSFSDKLWQAYARKTVPSVLSHISKSIPVEVWYNGEFSEEWSKKLPTVSFVDMNRLGDYQYFRQAYKRRPMPENVPDGHKFRFNFLPFWNKVCAIRNAAKNFQEQNYKGYMVWLDADIYSSKPFSEKDLDKWINGCDVASLSRTEPWNTWESGFMAFNLDNPEVLQFIEDVYQVYMSGQIFDMNEWHDAYLFTSFFKKYRHRLTHAELNMIPSAHHCFDSSVLLPQLAHLKGGQRKITGTLFDPQGFNAVLKADWIGAINVKDGPDIKITKAGNIVVDGVIRNA